MRGRYLTLVDSQFFRNEDAHAALESISTAAKAIVGSRVAANELAALGKHFSYGILVMAF